MVDVTSVFRGTVAGDGTGDPPYTAFGKVNDNDAALAEAINDLPALGSSVAVTASVELDATHYGKMLSVNPAGGEIFITLPDPGFTTKRGVYCTVSIVNGDAAVAVAESVSDTLRCNQPWASWSSPNNATVYLGPSTAGADEFFYQIINRGGTIWTINGWCREASGDNTQVLLATEAEGGAPEGTYEDRVHAGATITFGTPTSWDVSAIVHGELTMTDDATINVSGMEDGTFYLLRLIQDGTGSRVPTWGSGFNAVWMTNIKVNLGADEETVFVFRGVNDQLAPAFQVGALGVLDRAARNDVTWRFDTKSGSGGTVEVTEADPLFLTLTNHDGTGTISSSVDNIGWVLSNDTDTEVDFNSATFTIGARRERAVIWNGATFVVGAERLLTGASGTGTANNWTPTDDATTARTIDDDDHELLVRLTQPSAGVTISLADTTAVGKTGGLLKSTDQTVTVQFAGNAVQLLPDGTTSAASFELTGGLSWICMANSDATHAIYYIEAESDQPTEGLTLGADTAFDDPAASAAAMEVMPLSGGTFTSDVDHDGNNITNVAGLGIVGAIALGTNGTLGDAGPLSATGALTRALHSGRTVLTTGNVTIPNAAGDVGMGGVIKLGGSHTITFNSTVTGTLAAGDVFSYYVQSTTVLIRSLRAAGDEPAMS